MKLLDTSTLVKMQVFWLMLAIGFNLVSIWRVSEGGQALISGRDPVHSIVFLLLFLLPIGLTVTGYHRASALSNIALLLPLFVSGLIIHVLRYFNNDQSMYLSQLVWSVAVLINLYGVLVGVLLSISAWKRSART